MACAADLAPEPGTRSPTGDEEGEGLYASEAVADDLADRVSRSLRRRSYWIPSLRSECFPLIEAFDRA